MSKRSLLVLAAMVSLVNVIPSRAAPPRDADLRLTKAQDDGEKAPAATDLREVPQEGAFLDSVEAARELQASQLEAAVRVALKNARSMVSQEPGDVVQELKYQLEAVRQSSVDPEVKVQLTRQLQSGIKEGQRLQTVRDAERSQAEEAKAAARDRARMLEDLTRKRMVTKNLMDKFNSIMQEAKTDPYQYRRAEDDIAAQILEEDPKNQTAILAKFNARFRFHIHEMNRLRELRHKMYVEALYQVELSHVPFPDEPPIVYPDPEIWEELTLNRKKYASVSVGNDSKREKEILAELDNPTNIEFDEETLDNIVDYLSETHDIPIVLDVPALDEIGFDVATNPITKNLTGISLRAALRNILGDLELTYTIKDEVLSITTQEKAETELITRVYPVGDLVVPIMSGMGGGGGGMFAVEEELSLGTKKAVAAPIKRPKIKRSATAQDVTAEPAEAAPVKLDRQPGESLSAAWNRFFTEHANGNAAERRKVNRMVRVNVRLEMNHAESLLEKDREKEALAKVQEVVHVLQAALRHGFAQPWMYEALGLAMRTVQAPAEEIERAIMSAVDFSRSPEDVLWVASYLAANGFDQRAIQLFQDVAASQNFRPEPYIHGLAAAQRLNDIEGLRWACEGILSHAWPREHHAIERKAKRVAMATLKQLREDGQQERASQFESVLNRALVRDCVVKVTWTGDADIDVMVEEPGGTICSLRNPRTTSGGVILGDTSARAGVTPVRGYSETYVCSKAFAGQYQVFLRRIWGKVTAGKVTIDIYTNYRTKGQNHLHRQLEIGDKDAIVTFELDKGRRAEPLEEVQLARVVQDQEAVGRAIAAQMLSNLDNSLASEAYQREMRLAKRDGRLRRGRPRGQSGFRPVLTVLPSGSMFFTSAVISADRRYVRVTPMPMFSSITDVFTFNFASGEQRRVDDDDDEGGGGGGGGGGGQ